MAKDVDVRLNMAGWNALAMSPDILAACIKEAEKGKAFAISISPRSSRPRGKPYADSFDVVPSVNTSFRNGPRRRVCAFLFNDAPHAAAVEFGNRQTPQPHRVLGRTAAFLGNA